MDGWLDNRMTGCLSGFILHGYMIRMMSQWSERYARGKNTFPCSLLVHDAMTAAFAPDRIFGANLIFSGAF